MSEFYITTGDREPNIRATLKDGNGNVIPLGSATGVDFAMSQGGARIAGSATIVDAAGGVVEYAWSAGDTDQSGNYKARWRITWSNGDTQSVPSNGYDWVIVQKAL